MKVIPLHSNVLIKQQDETETMYGNIIVPDLLRMELL
jgi:co-chaperonin GroES (HSP10)